MSDFETDIRLRLSSNANDFDGIVSDMLKEIERLNARIKEFEEEFKEALYRIDDLLLQDDGQAYKEARKFWEKHK